MHSCVRVAYTRKDNGASSGFGLLDSISLGAHEHQPRLSALFHRLRHLYSHSLTCSVCGPIELSLWFCNHCHLSLCANCWAQWQYPEATTNIVAESSRTLRPSSSCLDFRVPLRRAPFSSTVIAGGLTDLSHLHIPVVVVAVLGMVASPSFPLSQALEYTTRDHANTAGYGSCNFRIATNTCGSTVAGLKKHVDAVCALVRGCYAGRFVLDLRAHACEGRYEFKPHFFTTAELFAYLIKPITRAFRDAQRLTRGRYPAFDSSRAAVAASRILVVLHSCDTEFTTFLQMLDELLASEGIAVEQLLFQRPLLLKEMNNILPSLMPHYCNALCPLSTFDLLEQTTSPAQREKYRPTFFSPIPGRRSYQVRLLGAVARAPLSLSARLSPGGLVALSRRSDPFGAYAPPAVESLAPVAASRSAAHAQQRSRPFVLRPRSPFPVGVSCVLSSSAAAAAAASGPSLKRALVAPAVDAEPTTPLPRSVHARPHTHARSSCRVRPHSVVVRLCFPPLQPEARSCGCSCCSSLLTRLAVAVAVALPSGCCCRRRRCRSPRSRSTSPCSSSSFPLRCSLSGRPLGLPSDPQEAYVAARRVAPQSGSSCTLVAVSTSCCPRPLPRHL